MSAVLAKVRTLSQVKLNKRLCFAAKFVPITESVCFVSILLFVTHGRDNGSGVLFQKHASIKLIFIFIAIL